MEPNNKQERDPNNTAAERGTVTQPGDQPTDPNQPQQDQPIDQGESRRDDQQ